MIYVTLSKFGIGCFVGSTCVNHLCHADDLVLFAPSSATLQMLLDICDGYTQTHDIALNFKKSSWLTFLSKSLKLRRRIFYLRDTPLLRLKEHKYLGAIISDDNYNDVDTRRQTRSLYTRGNTVVRKFGSCLDSVKIIPSVCIHMVCYYLLIVSLHVLNLLRLPTTTVVDICLTSVEM